MRLREVLEITRIVREACELGNHPQRWRSHVVNRLTELLQADDGAAAFVDVESPLQEDAQRIDQFIVAQQKLHSRTLGRNRIVSIIRLPGTASLSVLAFTRATHRPPFDARQRRLLEIFHDELARLWTTPVLGGELPGSPHALSPRLRQVLDMLIHGADEKRIAKALGRSRHTVHNHVRNLYRRLGVKSRAELLAMAGPPTDFRPRLV